MSVELQERMVDISEGTQNAITQSALIFAGIVNGNLTDPVVQQAIADAKITAQTTNEPSRWIAGLLAEAATNGSFTPGGGDVTQAELDAEIVARAAVDTALSTLIADEVTNRTTAVGNEAAARAAADTALAALIGGGSVTQGQLDAEAAIRETADNVLTAALVVEANNRAAAIAAEVTARATADATEAGIRAAADAAEIIARVAADALKQDLDADLTAIAGLSTTAFGRGGLTQADATAFRSYIGAGAGGGDALVANPLSQFASTTSAQLRSVLSDELGTGRALFEGAAISGSTITSGTVADAVIASTIARTSDVTAEAGTRAAADTAEAGTRAAADTAEAGTRAAADTALDARVDLLERGMPIVTTNAELDAALLLGEEIYVLGFITRPGTAPITFPVAGTKLKGFGPLISGIVWSNAAVTTTMFIPVSVECSLENMLIDGGATIPTGVLIDGTAFGATNFLVKKCKFVNCSYGIRKTGGPASTDAEILNGLRISHNEFDSLTQSAIYLAWEMNGLTIDWNYVHDCNSSDNINDRGIFAGLGINNGVIHHNYVKNCRKNGIEIYYADADPTVPGQSGPARISTQNPFGTAMRIHDNYVDGELATEIGISVAGCKRTSTYANIIKNTIFIGLEIVDEDNTKPTAFTAWGNTITNSLGTAVSIDKCNGGTFMGNVVDKVTGTGPTSRGILIQAADDILLTGNFVTECSGVYIEVAASTRVYVIGNIMVARDGEATGFGPDGHSYGFYAALSTGVYQGNVLRPSTTNDLRCDLGGVTTFYIEPFSKPLVGAVGYFRDGQNTLGMGADTVVYDSPVFSRTQTWNAAGVVFHSYILNAVKTAAAAGSTIFQVNLADSPLFEVLPEGARVGGTTGTIFSKLRHGVATLIGGTIVVTDANVTANTRIFLASQVPGGTPGWLSVSARTVATSFTILSSSALDTSTVAYLLLEP